MGPPPFGGGGGGHAAALAAEDPTPMFSLPSEVRRRGGGARGLTMAALPKQTYTLACMLSFTPGILPRVNGNLPASVKLTPPEASLHGEKACMCPVSHFLD